MTPIDSQVPKPPREPALRAIAMPADANPSGDIFGGWLLAQMDLAGGSAAMQRADGRVATVAITGMTFHQPVFVGDEVSCYATITRVGRTSITIAIESWARRHRGNSYVAIDADRRPRAVPSEAPDTIDV
jgi:acyl-CoA thioesterase YciA